MAKSAKSLPSKKLLIMDYVNTDVFPLIATIIMKGWLPKTVTFTSSKVSGKTESVHKLKFVDDDSKCYLTISKMNYGFKLIDSKGKKILSISKLPSYNSLYVALFNFFTFDAYIKDKTKIEKSSPKKKINKAMTKAKSIWKRAA